jgi:hypothetical protein
MADSASADKPQEWVITNEFAQVRLTIDTLGNDPRLKIEDLATNLTIALDAFMLAGLTTTSEEELKRHMGSEPEATSAGYQL